MQQIDVGNSDCWINNYIPPIRQLDINNSVGANSDNLAADCLNSVAQIAHEIDRANRMALAANFLQLKTDAIHRAVLRCVRSPDRLLRVAVPPDWPSPYAQKRCIRPPHPQDADALARARPNSALVQRLSKYPGVEHQQDIRVTKSMP